MNRYLEKLPYWEHLNDEERLMVGENSVLTHYDKGTYIHGGSNDCLGMILVISGEVRTYLMSEEGREITLFRLYEADPCVLSASCVITEITFDTHMVAERDCDILVVNTGAFAALTEKNIYVKCFMYELATERFSAVMWSMQQILFMGMDRRLATFLIGELDRTGIPEIRMTHEQIAQHISSAREVVARMVKRFAAEGLVEVSRGTIKIKNEERLRKFSVI
ncbi:MAG: Crp/Fnr family transcriptional regulator [Clostridiales bacterium]|nr:Crp/Fnr family transcriptional regulator [Clostridiales bacterium]